MSNLLLAILDKLGVEQDVHRPCSTMVTSEAQGGNLFTPESCGDVQSHLEHANPSGTDRAIYGEWPPRVVEGR
jgi:hypothetical protein